MVSLVCKTCISIFSAQFYYKTDLMIRCKIGMAICPLILHFMLKDIWYIFLVLESPKLYLRSAIVSTVDTMKTRHDEKQSWMKRRLDV